MTEVRADAGAEFFTLATSPENREDPYPLYASVRASTPLVDTGFGLWFAFEHETCAALLRDPRSSSDERRSVLFDAWVAEHPDTMMPDYPTMLFLDPPDHTRLRNLVAQAFTPRRIELIRPRAEELVTDLLDACAEMGSFDVVDDLAYPLPVTMICEMLGVPVADHERFGGWSKALAAGLDPGVLRTPEQEQGRLAAMDAFVDYFGELIAERSGNLGDDLLSALIAAEADGERLTREELLGTGVLLLVAGHETTVNLISNGMLALLRHPDQLELLRARPDLDRPAVDELLRYDSPVQMSQRIATEPMAFGGMTVGTGQSVVVVLGAANRDPKTFDDPDRLDITRSSGQRHVAFGGGIHHCLGSALARVEGETAIGGLVRRFPALRPDGDPVRRPTFTLRGLEHLPVTVG